MPGICALFASFIATFNDRQLCAGTIFAVAQVVFVAASESEEWGRVQLLCILAQRPYGFAFVGVTLFLAAMRSCHSPRFSRSKIEFCCAFFFWLQSGVLCKSIVFSAVAVLFFTQEIGEGNQLGNQTNRMF